MAVTVKKYNPGFLTDDQIIESFCVRTNEFESIVETLRENRGNSNAHTIVIGPRGSGKTHLLMRVAAQVRTDVTLNGYYPIIFPEESYEISTCGEFWLECLHHLVQQAPADERNSLELSYNDLSNETNDIVLGERCLGALLDFAERREKRLLLVAENLNMLFEDIGDPEAGWQLRKTLQTEPRIMLLASATSRFDEIDQSDRAMYDLFRSINLRPLDTGECEVLWRSISGPSSTDQTVRPIEILTGGNPRLITIIATFGVGRSFQELMDSLLDLVDDHTEYFKSHLEHLPPQERRVYLALARLWKPATTKEVAELARLDTNKCSSLLKRLTDRGDVAVEGGTPRRRQFYLTERLYNIYYLLRRGGGTERVVEALIDFMVSCYSPTELWDIVKRTYISAREAGVLAPEIFLPVATTTFEKSRELFERGDWEDAISELDRLIDGSKSVNPDEVRVLRVAALSYKASILNVAVKRHNEVIDICDSALAIWDAHGDTIPPFYVGVAFLSKGVALVAQGEMTDAIDALNGALSLVVAFRQPTADPKFDALGSGALLNKAFALWKINQSREAMSLLDLLIEMYGGPIRLETSRERVVDALVLKTRVMGEMGKTISHVEFTSLLEHLLQTGLREQCIDALVRFAGTTGPATTLQLIEDSGAAEILLPLVTALKQELGQSPRVAKEVEEVAKDIREGLAQHSDRISSIPIPSTFAPC